MPRDVCGEGVTVVYATRRQVLASSADHRKNDDIILTVTGSPLHSPRPSSNLPTQKYPIITDRIGQRYTGYPNVPVNDFHNNSIHYQEYPPYHRGQYYPVNEEFRYIETYTKGPITNMRRKSLEGLAIEANMTTPHRILDVHNLDHPPYWIPLHPITNDAKQNSSFLGRKLGPSLGEKISQTIGHNSKHRRSPKRMKIEEVSSSIQFIDTVSPIDVAVTETSNYPDHLYPIFLPMDQAFKTKYVFATRKRRGKTIQERVYRFLEHPCGWICFTYHFLV